MQKKKVFLLATAAILALSACSNDSELGTLGTTTDHPIEFRTINDDKSTRAAITDKDNLLSFTVTGYWTAGSTSVTNSGYLFNAFDITRGETTATNKWLYTPLMYWPTGGTANFYAYSPASSKNLSVGLKDYTSGTITYKVPKIGEKEAQEDFLVAKAIGKNEVPTPPATVADPIMLNFHHALSRVKFFAKTTSEDMTYVVDEIALVNLKEEGTLNLSTLGIPETGSIPYSATAFPSWTATGNVVDYTADMGKSPIKLVYDEFSSLLGETNAILVMPQPTTLLTTAAPTAAKEFAIKISYKAYAGDIYYAGSESQSAARYFAVEDLTTAATTDGITFEMGRQYAFYLIFGDDAGAAIDFKVTVEDWNDADDINL